MQMAKNSACGGNRDAHTANIYCFSIIVFYGPARGNASSQNALWVTDRITTSFEEALQMT